MGHEIVYCGRCQSRLTSADFDKGKGVRLSAGPVCTDCLVPSERAAPAKAIQNSSGTRRSVPARAASRRLPLLLAGAAGVAAAAGIAIFLLLGKSEPPPPEPPKAPAPTARAAEPPGLDAELGAFTAELAGPLAKGDIRVALMILNRAKGRRADAGWERAIGGLERDVVDRAGRRFAALKAGVKTPDDLRAAKDEVSGWGPAFGPFLMELDAVAVAAAPPPKPEPAPAVSVPAPPPAPAPPSPNLAPWTKAMEFATRGDYARAIADLRELKEDHAREIQDLERIRALLPEMLKTAAALAPWEEVALDVVKEDGSRVAARSHVLRAGPRRLELRSEPRFVELEDVAPSSLAALYARKKPGEEPRTLALLCAIDGDAEAAKRLLGGAVDALPSRVWAYAEAAKGKRPGASKNEWSARTLFYEAEAKFGSVDTRGEAMERYARLLDAYADTEFMKHTGEEVTARRREVKDNVLAAVRLSGQGVFGLVKTPVGGKKEKTDLPVWRSKEDRGLDDPGNFVEARFYAEAGVEYKAWALVGGCCASTFGWYLQASELTTPDPKTRKPLPCEPGGNHAARWEHKIRGLSTTHGGKDHAKAEKEPSVWEWAELPMPKFASGGAKGIRLIGSSKGQAVAAVVVSAARDKKPADEDVKALAAAVPEEVPSGSLRCGKGEPDLLPRLGEALPYVLVFDLDLANLRRPIKYDVDHRAQITRPFDRIGYLVELQPAGKDGQYVFVTMDAFTEEIGKVGIPETGVLFQKRVSNLSVHSNVEGVPAGPLAEGNIEFWSNNYGPWNQANVPGAIGDKFDFGDMVSPPVEGYGSMQVHHTKAGVTLFAINKWSGGAKADLGIGNSPGTTRDWTFTDNATTYAFKRLRVLVRPR